VIAPDAVLDSHGPDEPSRFIAIADHFLSEGDPQLAASALDRAYGLAPDDRDLGHHRAQILDQLAVEENGIRWRYIPAGTFVMGAPDGDPDERPPHPRRLAAYWISDTPLTWATFCALLDFHPPEGGHPRTHHALEGFALRQRNKMRRRYSAPAPVPMIAAVPEEGWAITERHPHYALPSEAEWEKAARGGRVGARYAWGDEPPTPARCEFDHFGDWTLVDPRTLPANGYGVYGMSGGVWEWTADRYDALAYHRFSRGDSVAAASGDVPYVLRGGSWCDCADAVRVAFRTADSFRLGSPSVGLRLVRRV
jgi:formylglycine-generating enzyme required for sulfatase activity